MQYFDLFQRRIHIFLFFSLVFFDYYFKMAVPPQFCSVRKTNQIDLRARCDATEK